MLMCSVFLSSLGVLIRAGQEPYRGPLWRNVACSKVVSPSPYSLPLLPFPLSIVTSLAIHICLHSWLLLHFVSHTFTLLWFSAITGVKKSSYSQWLCCRPNSTAALVTPKYFLASVKCHFISTACEATSQILTCWNVVRISLCLCERGSERMNWREI